MEKAIISKLCHFLWLRILPK